MTIYLHILSNEGEVKGSAVMYSKDHLPVQRLRVAGDWCLCGQKNWYLCINDFKSGDLSWIKTDLKDIPDHIKGLALLLP